MRKLFMLLSAALLLCAYTDADRLIHEGVVTNMLKSMVAAETYDAQCNGGKRLVNADAAAPHVVTYFSNMQLIAARLYTALDFKTRGVSQDDAGNALLDMKEALEPDMKAAMKTAGCTSKMATDAAKVLDMLTTTDAVKLNRIIDAQIVKKGGAVPEVGGVE